MAQSTKFVPAKTNHLLHALLSVLTLGSWLGVYLVVAIVNQNKFVKEEEFSS